MVRITGLQKRCRKINCFSIAPVLGGIRRRLGHSLRCIQKSFVEKLRAREGWVGSSSRDVG